MYFLYVGSYASGLSKLVSINLWPFNMTFKNLKLHMSQCMRFPTIWYVRPAKAQTSLRIRAV